MSDLNLEFARGGAKFTVELFNTLAAGGVKKNILFSPFSIQTCLALAFAGAVGETADEIAKVMQFVSNSPSEVAATVKFVLEKYKNDDILKIANKVYVQEGYNLKVEYANSTKENYHAEAEEINFIESDAAAESINSWVKNKTAGKITDIVDADSFTPLTRLVLLNALHFKGDWEKKFHVSDTEEGDFWISETEAVTVEYMNQESQFSYGYFEDLNCQALDMPYKDSDLSMFILLPEKREGLKDLVEKLKDINLIDLAERMDTRQVDVELPKFKVEHSIDLSNILKQLGITKAFGSGSNFRNIFESSEDIFVSNVFHKCCIETNEEGCEAAAATAMIMMYRMEISLEFHADRPFLYMIWNKRNILFVGVFVNAPQ